VEESQDLLLELASALDDPEAAAAAETLLDLPVLYASGREGKASTENPGNGNVPDAADLQALFDVIHEVLPEPSATIDAPLQAHVTNLDSSSFLGRIALVRIHAGTLKKGQQVAWIHYDDEGNQHIKNVKIAELLRTVGVDRESTSEAMVAGDIAAISGIGLQAPGFQLTFRFLDWAGPPKSLKNLKDSSNSLEPNCFHGWVVG